MTGRHHHAVAASTVFDGETVHRDAAVMIDGQHITGIGQRHASSPNPQVHRLPDDAWLAPAFIDLQVNGGGDILFNADPTRSALAQIAAAHRKFGTTSILPTLISDTRQTMEAALSAVQQSRTDRGILGIHLEGPFLSLEKPGVHDLSMLRQPGPGDLELLTSLRLVPTLVTLAPERVAPGFIAALVGAG